MKVSLILGHPNPGSFNHAIAHAAADELSARAHEVNFHDLYAEGFDPTLPASEVPSRAALPPLVRQHCDEIAQADGIVIVHPNWWGQPPAMMKGWIDRVLRPNVAYRFLEGDGGEGIPVGLLKAHAAVVLNTSNTPQEREAAAFCDPLEFIWKKCIFDLCGVKNVYREMFQVVITSAPEERARWLRRVREVVAANF